MFVSIFGDPSADPEIRTSGGETRTQAMTTAKWSEPDSADRDGHFLLARLIGVGGCGSP
jgi:hypothetical protein